MTIEDQINDILSTASFADEEARLACEEKLRFLIGERDEAHKQMEYFGTNAAIKDFIKLKARAEAAEARAAEYEKRVSFPIEWIETTLSKYPDTSTIPGDTGHFFFLLKVILEESLSAALARKEITND